jgi:septum site-determining protein MinC
MSLRVCKNQELVEFKGTKNGIIINIKEDAPFDVIKQNIIDRLEVSVGFFNGAKIASINSNSLSDIELIQIKHDITSRFDVEFIEEEKKEVIPNFQTKYVNNLRSGENVDFEGDVVVMSDMKSGSQVNSTSNVVIMGNIKSGARVVARGNVIVMGMIKGFVHAGSNGNENAYIVANNLNTKVLKIADNIAQAPDDYIEDKKINPEIAFVSNGMIVIESYLPKKQNNNKFKK